MKNKSIIRYSIILLLLLLIGLLFYPATIHLEMKNCSISTPNVKLLIKIDGEKVLVTELNAKDFKRGELSLQKKFLDTHYLFEVSTIDNKFLCKETINVGLLPTMIEIGYCGKSYFKDSLYAGIGVIEELMFSKEDTINVRVNYGIIERL